MFERKQLGAQLAQVNMGTVSAQITLDDGRVLIGKFVIPVNKSIFEVLNGACSFVDFETFEGERELVSKQTVRAVKLLSVPKGEDLETRLRNLDGFDPHAILGVKAGADWQTIRQAYLSLAKTYHPDRFCNVDLPAEVAKYVANMAKRITTAYGALEAQHGGGRQAVKPGQSAPIFSS